MLKTIEKNDAEEIIVKKSRFIANIFYIENEEDAIQQIKKIKRQYYDAKHNCYAYRIKLSNLIVERYSDDGEPAGTAGQPILNILRGEELENVLIVVTRYFGGVLLGTGGLVKAYTDSAKAVVKNENIIKKTTGKLVKFKIAYEDLDKLNYYMRQNNIKIYKTDYSESIEVFVEIDDEKFVKIKKNLNDINFRINQIEILEEKALITIVE